MKTRIILNPNAGSAVEVEHLQERLGELDATIERTQQPGDAERLARQALDEDDIELVVAAGGDGTLNEVINGLSHNFGKVKLGLLPLGTGNDFARSINVPNELDHAIEILEQAHLRTIDVVRVTGGEDRQTRHFINVSAGGFSTLVNDKMNSDIKQAWGPLSYLRSAIEAIPEMSDYRTSISYDDEPAHELHVYNIVIANAKFVAGGVPIAPEADIDDGLLDVVIVPSASFPQLALLVPQIMTGNHLSSDLVTHRRARRVRITSVPPLSFNIDGEAFSNVPITYEVLPAALQVLAGPQVV